jgi:hypothetical protein
VSSSNAAQPDASSSNATRPDASSSNAAQPGGQEHGKAKQKHHKAAADKAVADTAATDGEKDDNDATGDTRDGDVSDPNGTLGRFRFMLQLRYRQTFVDEGQLSPQTEIERAQKGTSQADDGYDIQRAFMRYTVKPSRYIEAKILMDFAELRHNNVRQSFKLAYLQLHPTKQLEFDIGLLKRTYSLLELLPIVDHELADLGPTDSFIKDQGYAGRDVGAVVRYSPLSKRKWLTVSVGAFRGDLDEGYDARPLKLMTARIEGFPWKHLRLGVNGAWRPYDNVQMQRLTDDAGNKYYAETVTLKSGKATGADATLLFKRLQVRAEGLYGVRTEPNQVGSDRFAAGWVVIAPNFKLGGIHWVPAAKLEWLDLNPAAKGGRRTIFTGVLGVIPMDGLRILADVTRSIVDDGLLAMSKVPWTKGNSTQYVVEPSTTVGTVQVQYQF